MSEIKLSTEAVAFASTIRTVLPMDGGFDRFFQLCSVRPVRDGDGVMEPGSDACLAYCIILVRSIARLDHSKQK